MNYYKYRDKYVFSKKEYSYMQPASEQEVFASQSLMYYLTELDAAKSRRSFALSDPFLLELQQEGLQLLQLPDSVSPALPSQLEGKLAQGMVKAINTNYPNWEDSLTDTLPKSWRVNIVGLGDVGSNLLIGLRLLGGDAISKIGIFDIDPHKMTRWELETNQILYPNPTPSPKVFAAMEEELFDCDMFVFCVTVGIPSVDTKGIDVRMVQFEGNSKIISLYAKKARKAGFKGIFAVVSDPVDLLCKKALIESNTDENGIYDFKGLAPEQIRGYGLGVMHARAVYYANQSSETMHYLQEGRAFGPHGEHLIIADSMTNYNQELSLLLTQKARTANLELRSHGYKPFVAPALSSGTISLLETIKGNWHYSATYMGGVYMGARNKLTEAGTTLERYDIPEELMTRLCISYKELERII